MPSPNVVVGAPAVVGAVGFPPVVGGAVVSGGAVAGVGDGLRLLRPARWYRNVAVRTERASDAA